MTTLYFYTIAAIPCSKNISKFSESYTFTELSCKQFFDMWEKKIGNNGVRSLMLLVFFQRTRGSSGQ